MVVAEQNNLKPVKAMISNAAVHLKLFENKTGNAFFSSGTHRPRELVYYVTTPSLLLHFSKTPSHGKPCLIQLLRRL